MEDKYKDRDCLNSLIMSVEALFDDAHIKYMELPLEEEEIYGVLNKCKKAFDEIEHPVVCHFDLWDGNIFASKSMGDLEVTGIIDFKRGFYACPAVD